MEWTFLKKFLLPAYDADADATRILDLFDKTRDHRMLQESILAMIQLRVRLALEEVYRHTQQP